MRYKDYNVDLRMGHYTNGRTAIELIDADDGFPVCVATVNLPFEPLNEGEVFIKDYSENEGMLAWLVSQGLAEDTGQRIQSGYVEVPIVKLNLPKIPIVKLTVPKE